MTQNRRQLLSGMFSGLAALCSIPAAKADSFAGFKPVQTQYIAALAEPGAKSGTGAEKWGMWRLDPGPRGVRLRNYDALVVNNGIAAAQWKFRPEDWWLEENGLIMEEPDYAMLAGRYVVTGDREAMTILTVHPKDSAGAQRWELADDATIYDVTHLRCRAARYTPRIAGQTCSPVDVLQSAFPLGQAEAMPMVGGCDKQDYAVLFIVGVE